MKIPFARALVATLMSTLLISACTENADSPKAAVPPAPLKPTMTEAQMLANIGENIVAPQTLLLAERAESLEKDALALCSALEGSGDFEVALEKARESWRQTMLTYHRVDSLPIGPALEKGRLIADNLYSWPYINACGIDLQVARLAATGKENPALITTLKGLGGLEYLLFENELGTACNPQSVSSKPALQWAAKDARAKRLDRCRFAAGLSRDVKKYSSELAAAWNPAEGGAAKSFVDGSKYKSAREAVNAVTDAMFSIEKTKDETLGKPLGLHKDCQHPSRKCVELTEHPWSGLTLDSVKVRIEFFRELFTGKDGPGFDDYLAKMNRGDVSAAILSSLDDVLLKIDRSRAAGPLKAQIEAMDVEQCRASTVAQRLVEPCSLYQDLRAVTLKLKTDFLTALSLKAPPTYQGDND